MIKPATLGIALVEGYTCRRRARTRADYLGGVMRGLASNDEHRYHRCLSRALTHQSLALIYPALRTEGFAGRREGCAKGLCACTAHAPALVGVVELTVAVALEQPTREQLRDPWRRVLKTKPWR